MKITINVDCTPEEARSFLGLPDFKPMQDEVMNAMREQMMSAVASTDPTEMLRLWTSGISGFDQIREMFGTKAGAKRDT